ncbi:SREC-like protein [Mya arenaria]|uniref:SREC-like protein n=1 Tax=Mya arenaria TaxID=6604 RepID=A0ABY7F6R2_MYAAR|nr:SREC-like protein [Mya arenaria]
MNGDICSRCPLNCKTCASSSSCSSCDPGYYGYICQQDCGRGCLDSKCAKINGTCLCRSGLFSDVYCNTCVLGKFGHNCDHECLDSCNSCSKSSNCESCKPGLFGHICEHNCSENCYNCLQSGQCLTCNTGHTHPSQSCVCEQSKCASSDNCNKCVSDEYFPDNGSCCPCSLLHHCISCTVSLNGTKCVACEEGYYPNEHGYCFNCSVTCIEGECDSVSGKCKKGCTDGYFGKLCKQRCQDSCYKCNRYSGECLECVSNLNYGPNCNKHCSETCVDKVCDILGVCTKGCSENYFGVMCENECDKHCIQITIGTMCSSENGECLHGCTAGYIAAVCPKAPQDEKQITSSSRVVALGGGVGGDDEDAIARENAIRFEENGGAYYNNANEVNKIKVKVEELPAYVTAKTKCSYVDEFERFPYGLTKPFEDSQKASNMSRNRYKGIYPYDDSRVKGFKKRNEYIATLERKM